MNKIQNFINHIVFVVDRSGSMARHAKNVVSVFDNQIKHLAQSSKELNQETRVSVYVFDSRIECLIYDMDVMRLPSLAEFYKVGGNTAFRDATIKASEELSLTPELYANHAFLVYMITDGYDNESKNSPAQVSKLINNGKDNWTFACLVPDSQSRQAVIQCGFTLENIQLWAANSKDGITEAGNVIRQATDNYMAARARGMRSTKNLFHLNTNAITTVKVVNQLTELTPSQFALFPVHKESVIQPFVESWTQQPYRKGSAYFMLTKPENVQNYKQVCLQDKATGKVYSGPEARQMLGLPDFEVKVSPSDHPKFNIFIQSTSANRKLVAGTQLIVLN